MDNNPSFVERYLTPIAVVIGALILALAYVYGHGSTPPATGTAGTAPASASIDKVKLDGEPFIGDANAPVTIAFFFDYQCPFCKQFEESVTPQLYSNYVQTGKLKIVFKGFEFLGQDSIAADEFGRAVWALYPDHFYEWYVAMFGAQDQEGDQGFGDQPSIVTMTKAQVPSIDTDKVAAYIAKNKAALDATIASDRQEGASLGVNGTPSVIMGNQLLSGMSPTDFYSAISGYVDSHAK